MSSSTAEIMKALNARLNYERGTSSRTPLIPGFGEGDAEGAPVYTGEEPVKPVKRAIKYLAKLSSAYGTQDSDTDVHDRFVSDTNPKDGVYAGSFEAETTSGVDQAFTSARNVDLGGEETDKVAARTEAWANIVSARILEGVKHSRDRQLLGNVSEAEVEDQIEGHFDSFDNAADVEGVEGDEKLAYGQDYLPGAAFEEDFSARGLGTHLGITHDSMEPGVGEHPTADAWDNHDSVTFTNGLSIAGGGDPGPAD